jgi:predicted naringenin-chalcone synthase
MTQEEALKMSTNIICQDERQRRLMRVLFRKAAVQKRHTAVPHPIAYEWLYKEQEARSEELRVESRELRAESGEWRVEHGALDSRLSTLHSPEGNGQPVCNWGPTTRERMQLYADNAAPLAKQAVTNAFREAGLEPRDVTHLVTVSCTGFDAPGIDIELIDTLGLRLTTQRVNVGYMGCHGAINGLRVAKGIVGDDPGAVVLLSATELCSLHYRFNWDDEGIIGNALFADGSAALVLANTAATGTHAASGSLRAVRATGSCLIPDSRQVMSWRVCDHGFEMRLTAEVAEKINTYLRPWISEWLGQYGYTVETVGSWAVHPGGPRILSAVEEALSLPREATRVSHQVLAEHGNMSSPTVLFILDRLRKADAKRPCVALGFGPGLYAEAALFE